MDYEVTEGMVFVDFNHLVFSFCQTIVSGTDTKPWCAYSEYGFQRLEDLQEVILEKSMEAELGHFYTLLGAEPRIPSSISWIDKHAVLQTYCQSHVLPLVVFFSLGKLGI